MIKRGKDIKEELIKSNKGKEKGGGGGKIT